jgi:HlyD family secretion protein
VVYVLRDDKLTAVPVKTGLTDGSFTEVIEGLKEGDKVVTGLASAKPAAAASAATVNPFAPPRFPGGGRGGPR